MYTIKFTETTILSYTVAYTFSSRDNGETREHIPMPCILGEKKGISILYGNNYYQDVPIDSFIYSDCGLKRDLNWIIQIYIYLSLL